MSRLPVAALLLATLAAPALAADKPAAPPTGHTRAFLDPLGRLWETPGRDNLEVWFAATDTNGDGKIDRAEIIASAKAWFKTLDLNGDGVIDPDEETAYENDRTGGHGNGTAGVIMDHEFGTDTTNDRVGLLNEHRGRGGRGGGRRGGRGGRGGGEGDGGGGFGGPDEDRTGALMDVSNPVVSADVNLDRGVTLQEAINAATNRLSRLDLDGDGALSLAEARRRRDAQASTVRQRAQPSVPAQDQDAPPQ